MRFILLITALLLISDITFATQQLSKNQFIYQNLTASKAQDFAVAINTTAGVNLMVLPSNQLNSFMFSKKIMPIYNKTVTTGIFDIPVPPGNYTIICKATNPINLDFGVVAIPSGTFNSILVTSQYNYSFFLSNYSSVRFTILSASDFQGSPIVANFSSTSGVISSPTNFNVAQVTLNRGKHTFFITPSSPITLLVLLNSTPQLVNPLADTSPGVNYSVGVASYGLFNISGVLQPYQVKTSEIVGAVNISLMSAYTNNPPTGASPNGASIQLNAVLNANFNGTTRVYWLQNVADFNTSSGRYYFVDNIWNNTNPSASVSNTTVVGPGTITSCTKCNNQYIYAYAYPNYYLNYSLPLSLKLVIVENSTSKGTLMSFGYQILMNGTEGSGPLIFYDKVLVPGTSNATLLTTPYYYTPAGKGLYGNYYDTELVFAGESNGANTRFTSLGSSLWIYYYNNMTLKPFPSVYTFGLSTSESASNARAQAGPQGAVVIIGTPILSKNLLAPGTSAYARYLYNTSKNVASPITTTKGGVTTPQQLVINPSSTIKNLELILMVAIAIMMIIIFMLRRRWKKRLESMGYYESWKH